MYKNDKNFVEKSKKWKIFRFFNFKIDFFL